MIVVCGEHTYLDIGPVSGEVLGELGTSCANKGDLGSSLRSTNVEPEDRGRKKGRKQNELHIERK